MKTGTITQTVEFKDVSPQEVYDALMTSKGHSQATGGKAVIDARVGGKFSAWDGYIFGETVELVKGKKIVQSWKTTEWPEGAEDSVAEFVLSQTAKGTKLVLTHKSVPFEQMDSYASGWKEFYWEPMAAYFAKAGKKK